MLSPAGTSSTSSPASIKSATLVQSMFNKFTETDFQRLGPGPHSFLDLGAAPGVFADFLINFQERGAKIRTGHCVTLGEEHGREGFFSKELRIS